MIGKCLKTASLAGSYAALLLRRLRRAGPPDETRPRRILVLGYAAIGDLIFLLPTLRVLRDAFPQASITFLADRYAGTEELLPASGLVDDIWLYEHSELAQSRFRREIFRRVRAAGFDALVVSQATPMRAFAQAILGIPLRVGHCRPLIAPHAGWSRLRYAWWRLLRGVVSGEFERLLALNRPVWVDEDREHTVSRNLRLAQALGLAVPKAEASRPELPVTLTEVPDRTMVGLHVGSPLSAYHKIWPVERWGEVCRRLSERFPLRFALFGGPQERDLVRPFAAAFKGEFADLVGRTSLLQTFAAIRRCRLFLSNDTGLSKSAMALGVPTATVWGPSDRPGYGVIWEPEKHLEISLDIACSPCVRMGLRQEGSGVINFDDCGHHDCLNRMTPELVLEALTRWISSRT